MDVQTIRKNNMRIFPIYKMFAWDLLFYYAILFLFLTQVKGLSASQILFLESLYALFCVFFQLSTVRIVDILGKFKSLFLGNLLIFISIVLLIFSKTMPLFILFNLLEAIGFNLKDICQPTILSDSIPKSSSSSKIFAKINGKGDSRFYLFDAISALATGFLYIINPYIPMILCCLCSLISTILSLAFDDPLPELKNKTKTNGNNSISDYRNIINTFKKIIKSNRLKSLFVFALLFNGILASFNNLKSSILVDINLPEQYFGIIFAVMQIISSISVKHQYFIHKKLRNRALTWFALPLVSAFIIVGILVSCKISFVVSLVGILLLIILFGLIKGPYYILIKKYLNSFSNPIANTKIFAIYNLVKNLGRIIISLFASLLLKITITSYVFIIIGTVTLIIFIYLLNYMKTRVGLKPKEYPEEDLVFSNEFIKK